MVLLPKGLVETCCAGYFWHIQQQQLYSIKKAGTLKPLKHITANGWNNWKGGYSVSHLGKNYKLTDEYLEKLTESTSTFPIHHRYYES